MFIEIHHDPQQYHKSGNKKKTTYINTEYIVAINVTDFSVSTTSGSFIHVDGKDLMKIIEVIEIV